MKIGTKTFLLTFSISIVLALALTATYLIYDTFHQGKYENFAIQNIESFTKWNNRFSNKILSPFTREYIKLTTQNISDDVEYELNKNSNLGLLSKNKNLLLGIEDSVKIGNLEIGYLAIINSINDTILLSSYEKDMGMSIRDVLKHRKVRQLYNEIKANNKAEIYMKYEGEEAGLNDSYVYAQKISNTGLIIVYSLYIEKYLAPANELAAKERMIKQEKTIEKIGQLFAEEKKYTAFFTTVAFIIIFILSIPLIVWFSRSISLPIAKLRDSVSVIARGEFNTVIEPVGDEEIVDLTNSFNFLCKELKAYTANLEKEIRQRQKVETEVEIARKIQASTLPKVEDDLISTKFEIGARLLPAEKVAGDFYDFFFAGDKLVLVMADVSGKGIPAAFFMALTKTLVKRLCFQFDDPKAVLEKANSVLSKSNSSSMFATVFLAFYNVDTGVVTYSNAGHENILHISAQGELNEIGEQEQRPLGLFEDSIFEAESLEIAVSDLLLFYTDGLTEAKSPDGVFFGEDRLRELSLKLRLQSSDSLCSEVVQSVSDYENYDLYDDLTIMAFKRLG